VLAGAAAVAVLAFPGVASAAVSSTVAGGALTVTSDADDAIAIACVGGNVKVNTQDPAPAAACNTITSIDVNGGPGANAISLTGVIAADFPNLTSVTIDGGDGNDTITGSDRADVIDGGGGQDRIVGDNNPAGTRDDSRGGAGDDTMVWNPGDGDDINEGGDGADTVEVNGGGGAEQFTVIPSATPGRIAFDRSAQSAGGAFSVDVGTSERLDMNANAGDDTFTADGALAALSFALDVDGGDGNDNIDGGDGADLLRGGGGDDRIAGDDNPLNTRDDARGEAGNDTMVWNPGDDDDINEGGDGIDVSEVNGGGNEQFTVKPSAVAGRVSFDRSAASAGGAFNVDIGTTEHLRLNAGDGDDRIRGSKGLAGLIVSTFNGDDGNDRIKGTDGPDALGGGKGHDVINARDKSADAVECGSGLDFALVDRRDTVRACELVLGGLPRVARVGEVALDGNVVALRLRCVATERCRGNARLRHAGRKLGGKKFELGRGDAKTIRVKLNRRGRRYVAADGKRMKLQINARDKQGNGWRTTTPVKLKR
jgi:Ca2+-binding RTX toxin-like protein